MLFRILDRQTAAPAYARGYVLQDDVSEWKIFYIRDIDTVSRRYAIVDAYEDNVCAQNFCHNECKCAAVLQCELWRVS